MTPADSLQIDGRPSRPQRVGRLFHSLAAAILILCAVSRAFISEHPFRTPPLLVPLAVSQSPNVPGFADADPPLSIDPVGREDLSRATYCVALLAALAIWLVGGAIAGAQRMSYITLAAMVAVFSCFSMASMLRADDGQTAILIWWEQVAMMSAAFLAAQLFTDSRRFHLLVCALSAMAATVAAKGLLQVFVDFPATYAHLRASPGLLTEMFGRQDSPTFEHLVGLRLTAMTPTGFFTLSNMLASLLLLGVAAVVGLLADRIVEAVRAVSKRYSGKRDVDVSSPLAATVACAIPAGVSLVVLVMTRSTGAIGAAALACAAGAAAAIFSRTLRQRWRRALLAVTVLSALFAGVTISYGLARDSLPTKTMTNRWYYWTASAEIVRDHPLLGVGGGNFPDAYLRYRRPEAEEAVKAPHNVMVHAAVQYGMLGGAAYLAVLAYLLVNMCRPRSTGQPLPPAPAVGRDWTAGLIGCAAVASIIVVRGSYAGAFASWSVFIWETLLPAGIFALVLAAVTLRSSTSVTGTGGSGIRIAMACGAAAFVLHNMVSFSLWTPGPATVFWVASGALLARAPARSSTIVRPRWLLGVLACAKVATVVILLWLPTWSQTRLWAQVNHSLRAGDTDAALAATMAASKVRDDPLSYAEAARLRADLAERMQPTDRLELLRSAMYLADIASWQMPANASIQSLAAHSAWVCALTTGDNNEARAALGHAQRAVELDPQNMPLRLDYAEMLIGLGQRDQAIEQLRNVAKINASLPADSVYRLSKDQRDRIDRLRADCNMP